MVSLSQALQFAKQKQVRMHAYMLASTHTHARTRTYARIRMLTSAQCNTSNANCPIRSANPTQSKKRCATKGKRQTEQNQPSQAKPSHPKQHSFISAFIPLLSLHDENLHRCVCQPLCSHPCTCFFFRLSVVLVLTTKCYFTLFLEAKTFWILAILLFVCKP